MIIFTFSLRKKIRLSSLIISTANSGSSAIGIRSGGAIVRKTAVSILGVQSILCRRSSEKPLSQFLSQFTGVETLL